MILVLLDILSKLIIIHKMVPKQLHLTITIIYAAEEEELSIQRLKNSFVYFLWSEMILFIKDGPLTLVDFIDWVGTR